MTFVDPSPIARSLPDDPTLDSQRALRLEEAVLCVDCNVLSNVARHERPSCGSRQRFPIQRWIERRPR